MKKKIIAFLLTITMVISLVACGQSSDGSGEKSTSGGSSDGGDKILTVWAWDKAFNIYAMQEAEKIYQKENPDFKLNIVEVSWDDMQTQLGTILSSGDYSQLPDILLMQDFAYQKYIMTYGDLFQDLTNSGIDFSQFSEEKVANSVADGKNYGVPFDNGTEIAAYRTDILEQAGYTIEDLTDITWDRFIEIGKDVLDKTGYSLFSSQAASADILMQMVQSAGGSIWKEDGTPYFVDNEILKESIKVYKELVDTGVMARTNSWDEYIGTFTSGKTLGAMNGCWIMASVETAKDQSGLWNVTNMPALPGISTATNYASQGGATWGITSNCKNTELAIDFLNKTFAGSKELYDTILPSSGAIATWTPAGESAVYAEPQEFYGGEPVFQLITEFATKTPVFNTGIYYTQANDAIAVAATNVCAGADIDSELKTAEETVSFNMGN